MTPALLDAATALAEIARYGSRLTTDHAMTVEESTFIEREVVPWLHTRAALSRGGETAGETPVEKAKRAFYEAARKWLASARANPMGVPWSVRDRVDAERAMDAAYDALIEAESRESRGQGGGG